MTTNTTSGAAATCTYPRCACDSRSQCTVKAAPATQATSGEALAQMAKDICDRASYYRRELTGAEKQFVGAANVLVTLLDTDLATTAPAAPAAGELTENEITAVTMIYMGAACNLNLLDWDEVRGAAWEKPLELGIIKHGAGDFVLGDGVEKVITAAMRRAIANLAAPAAGDDLSLLGTLARAAQERIDKGEHLTQEVIDFREAASPEVVCRLIAAAQAQPSAEGVATAKRKAKATPVYQIETESMEGSICWQDATKEKYQNTKQRGFNTRVLYKTAAAVIDNEPTAAPAAPAVRAPTTSNCTACGAAVGERCRTLSDDQCDSGRHVVAPVSDAEPKMSEGEEAMNMLPTTIVHTTEELRQYGDARAAHAVAQVLRGVGGESIDTAEFRKLSYAYAEALMHGTVPATQQAWAALVEFTDAKLPQARAAGAARDGWQLVPKEPTDDMVAAYSTGEVGGQEDQNVIACYKAMLAAAPSADDKEGQ